MDINSFEKAKLSYDVIHIVSRHNVVELWNGEQIFQVNIVKLKICLLECRSYFVSEIIRTARIIQKSLMQFDDCAFFILIHMKLSKTKRKVS